MRRALISVSDKSGIVEFAKKLITLGFEIISTGGTYTTLKNQGIPVIDISQVTNSPEIMEGRVKTLHPKVHGGLLCVRDNPLHMRELIENNISLIDLVVVNLYPFKETLERDGVTHQEIIENIDIGGPSMLRSAAKNYRFVTVCEDINEYNNILSEYTELGDTTLETRERLAYKVFARTAAYDTLISNYFQNRLNIDSPITLNKSYELVSQLRYGENPHQKGAFYKEIKAKDSNSSSLANAIQLNGKELSFNNIQDGNSAIEILSEFSKITVVAVKHMNPCGVASGETISQAWDRAYEADRVSIFGGVIATNEVVNLEVAKKMGELFLEIVIAPDYESDALEHLKGKKNLRVLRLPSLINKKEVGSIVNSEINKNINKNINESKKTNESKKIVSVIGGVLVQDRDEYSVSKEELICVTKKVPSSEELDELLFGFRVVKHVKSNAIVVSKGEETLGIGSGQMNRVGAANIALSQSGAKANGAILASDAFFPMGDTVKLAHEHGIKSIIQPGGSVRDKESIELCDEYGISMVFTNIRHFKH